MRYSNLEKKTFITRHILHQTLIHLFHRFISASKTSSIQVIWLLSQPLLHLRSSTKHLSSSCESICVTDTSHRQQSSCPQETRKRKLLCATSFWHGLHFDNWNQSLNMRMRVCCLHCHEAGLCCYLVIHIENLLHSLQLFLFPFVTYFLNLPPSLYLSIYLSPKCFLIN
jgi:hypothetical protein